ncbi:MAG TPA: VOC family protein [Acidimicrobiales bacterium]|jgi:catechol 2,3-dioxygenase-like lactoylglutathione lyase family enzyme
MSDTVPRFQQVNLVVRDMDAVLAFYRTLGLPIRGGDAGDWPPGSGGRHAEVEAGAGPTVEFDNERGVKLWHAGWRKSGDGARTVVGFSLPSRDAVDEVYAKVTAAGYPGRQPPYDAFWGARYAVVGDPEGNDVGLMSPIDPDRRYTPRA